MTTVLMQGESGSAEITLHSAVQLKVMGAALTAGGPVLASYQGGGWWLGRTRFNRISCHGRVVVEFRQAGTLCSFGPFIELALEADVVMADDTVIARFDPLNEQWQFGEVEADSMVICDALSLHAA